MDFKLKNIRIVIFACILVHNFLRDHCVDDMGADLRRDDDDPFEESDDEEGGDDIIEFDFESGDEWRAWMARAIWDEYVEMRAGETASAAEDTEYSPEEMGEEDACTPSLADPESSDSTDTSSATGSDDSGLPGEDGDASME
ncbi:hypothetical protein PHYSODRAFT_306667 [Phytophthora sojae]|uniref:DDE Tnp4 domain-containing protein n=1 Tax=Phytophthora sojae (strain P6497) TaxID=1094619 RepID=G5AA72_PHYSP|nr:hypothetical protein PHYSODRAFT_306667 [Phytophthora sojae]EGZ07501.1 hypothetical protein PHYSODRAFT_306667 [Phytophthora sojae]|eukprot:XP_009537067.1 hypothetical protein PHYSODRAFT_306667 [Phytophthora sojae]